MHVNKKIKKYVYYTHTNPVTQKQVSGEMNWWEWERIQKDPVRRKQFELDRIIDLTNPNTPPVVTAVRGQVVEVPVEEDPFECPICGFSCESDDQLQRHKGKEHNV